MTLKYNKLFSTTLCAHVLKKIRCERWNHDSCCVPLHGTVNASCYVVNALPSDRSKAAMNAAKPRKCSQRSRDLLVALESLEKPLPSSSLTLLKVDRTGWQKTAEAWLSSDVHFVTAAAERYSDFFFHTFDARQCFLIPMNNNMLIPTCLQRIFTICADYIRISI
eukprot:g38466.t1